MNLSKQVNPKDNYGRPKPGYKEHHKKKMRDRKRMQKKERDNFYKMFL